MKTSSLLIAILLTSVTCVLIFIFASDLKKRAEVREVCVGLEFEDWTGCVAEVALENGDASYCTAAGNIFSPWPKQCMWIFSQNVQIADACSTIFKPEARKSCNDRFEK